ncbi:hypothetical protein D9615_007744 [Tricholomella constricta]|uniref:Secreted protein n=1 Tax=Tricholomella constricta TaxID=117010 RepID=A0A8H5H3Y4_9AGAR|nr:hypothetical protein D9615_007744 [Tricholomella constricta]
MKFTLVIGLPLLIVAAATYATLGAPITAEQRLGVRGARHNDPLHAPVHPSQLSRESSLNNWDGGQSAAKAPANTGKTQGTGNTSKKPATMHPPVPPSQVSKDSSLLNWNGKSSSH